MGKSVCSNLIFRFRIAHLICCITICKSFFFEHYFRNYNACLGICAKKTLRRVLLLKASTSPAAEQPLRGVQCPSTRRGSGEERPMRGRSDPGDDGDEEEDNAGNGEESGPLTPLPASGRCKVVAVASLLCPPPQSRLWSRADAGSLCGEFVRESGLVLTHTSLSVSGDDVQEDCRGTRKREGRQSRARPRLAAAGRRRLGRQLPLSRRVPNLWGLKFKIVKILQLGHFLGPGLAWAAFSQRRGDWGGLLGR